MISRKNLSSVNLHVVTMTDLSSLLVSLPAVRFGRIPKREKQRLLDEMQSYMNSLNESAAMDMDSSSERDALPCQEDSNSKEAIGTISRAYRDIFTSSNSSNTQERVAKWANIPTTTNNNTSTFSQDASFPQISSHPNFAQSYQSCPVAPANLCPVAPNDNQTAFHNVENNRYTYYVSTNQNHDQSNGATPQSGTSANHNSFHNARSATNQPSCPWKLAQGAKVLVRAGSIFIITQRLQCCVLFDKTDFHYISVFFLSLRPVLSMRALFQG